MGAEIAGLVDPGRVDGSPLATSGSSRSGVSPSRRLRVEGAGRLLSMCCLSLVLALAVGAPLASSAIGDVTRFATASSPNFITTGPDGNVWFT